jgi:hypothetical protein
MSCGSVINTGASAKKTYDTDSITLRRIFAYDPITNSPPSTGYILTSLTKGVASFMTPLSTLSTVGWVELPAQISTVAGDLISAIVAFYPQLPSTAEFFLPSTVTGLATSGYISTTQLNSTIQGLGSIGYLSSAIFVTPVVSTVEGLGSAGYISTTQLTSTIDGLASSGYISTSQLASTIDGLGTSGYLSSFAGLGDVGFVSTSQLFSTVEGLGSSGYLSSFTTIPIFRSTFSNNLTGNWSNVAFLFSNFTADCNVNTIQFDMGNALRSKIIPGVTKLDLEFTTNLQFGYYDPNSRDYQFNTSIVGGGDYLDIAIIDTQSLTYYIQNDGLINIPYFFSEKSRFIVQDSNILNILQNDDIVSTISLYHTFGPNIPITNQFFASPLSTNCVTLILDNTPGAV